MTDTDKLELTNKALLELAYRGELDSFRLTQDLNKAGEKISALLEVERNLSAKIQELQTKNEGLELDLASLHETLEKAESELAKVRNHRDDLIVRLENQGKVIIDLQAEVLHLKSMHCTVECDLRAMDQ